jgi:putative transposase
MTKVNKKNKAIDQDLLKALVSHAEGQELFGRDGFFQHLKESLANCMLEGEMEHHLGYSKNSKDEKSTENRRNGHYPKSVVSSDETLNLSIPRDREGHFEPKLVPKGVRRFDGFDDKVISMYARGMTVREIQEHLYEIYGTEVSHDLISEVTDQVLDEVTTWQNRPLDESYPIVYLDCIHVKARDNHTIINKAVYLAIGVNMEGHKEVLGLWLSKNEGAKFWMQVVTELKNRGIQDILIACVDGLKGFEEAITAIFPETIVQLCIVHLIRNSMRFVPWKDRRAVARDLKAIYSSPSEESATQALASFQKKWDHKYPTIADIWQRNWAQIVPCLAFPEFIKKAIYTTNAIEAINRQIRKIIKNKGVFPNENSIKKLVYLALKNASKKWTMPIKDWAMALNQFAILFPDRVRV